MTNILGDDSETRKEKQQNCKDGGLHMSPDLEVPARLPPPRGGAVHDVIGDEEECLQELHAPTENIGES